MLLLFPQITQKQGHVRCSGGGVFGSLNHSSSSMKNMFRNQESQFNWSTCDAAGKSFFRHGAGQERFAKDPCRNCGATARSICIPKDLHWHPPTPPPIPYPPCVCAETNDEVRERWVMARWMRDEIVMIIDGHNVCSSCTERHYPPHPPTHPPTPPPYHTLHADVRERMMKCVRGE